MKRDFAALEGEFDLLVCGGGIYGAWTAYDATLRGLKVALIDQGDWASGTSSASSKLIHGGLRYLETYDFKLVRKALKERRMLLRAAPHRVWSLRFGVPVYKDSRNGMLKMKAGLMLYDALAGFPEAPMAHRCFDKRGFSAQFPFLDDANLKGGFTYGDAQTDDARLVLELVSGAMAHGAVCVNYTKLMEWQEDKGRVCAVLVHDEVGGETKRMHARQYVDATGRWASKSEAVRLSKGVHLVMPALQTDQAILLTAKEDGRVFFIIPWYGRTLLGTTDTDYRGDVDKVVVEDADIDYLLEAANHYFKTGWTQKDVIASYAGLRVMKQSDAQHPSSASRDWELRTAPNHVHHIIGGKLTSAREDASEVVDAVCAHLGVNRRCTTQDIRFPWKPEQPYAIWSKEMLARAQRLGIDATSAKTLLRRHGARVEELFSLVEVKPMLAERIVPDLPFIYADLVFCASNEMVFSLSDLLRNRLPLIILAKLSEEVLARILSILVVESGWDGENMLRDSGLCTSGELK
ncbi:MAG: glycerol-3-phosphate dehydrogenase/oxidase [Sideroxydans sp.]|nr:glycerol-3-phosphate dehydrogenase/oxidase [Sideroxydans sp.]